MVKGIVARRFAAAVGFFKREKKISRFSCGRNGLSSFFRDAASDDAHDLSRTEHPEGFFAIRVLSAKSSDGRKSRSEIYNERAAALRGSDVLSISKLTRAVRNRPGLAPLSRWQVVRNPAVAHAVSRLALGATSDSFRNHVPPRRLHFKKENAMKKIFQEWCPPLLMLIMRCCFSGNCKRRRTQIFAFYEFGKVAGGFLTDVEAAGSLSAQFAFGGVGGGGGDCGSDAQLLDRGAAGTKSKSFPQTNGSRT